MKKFLVFLTFFLFLFMDVTSVIETHNNLNEQIPKNGWIEIPAINLKREFVDSGNVDKNIIIINKSEYPNIHNSLLILAAHSGTGKYTFFNYLYKLEKNDIANIIYDNKQYSYELMYKYNIKKNGRASIYKFSDSKTLALVTCTNNIKNMQTVYIFKEKS